MEGSVVTSAVAHRVIGADEVEQARTAKHRILVPLEKSGDPSAALAVGRALGRALRVPLHGLFASTEPILASEVPPLIGLKPADLEGLVIDVDVGETVACLSSALKAAPGTILVLSAHSAAGSPLELSEVATRMLFESACGVVIVRPGMSKLTRISRILLPLDGTPSTAAAIAPIGAIARNAGAELDIVVVAEAHCAPCERGSMKPPLYVDQPHHEWPAYADEFLQRFVQAIGHIPAGVRTRLFLGAGDVGSEILRFAHGIGADLAVLVWHGDIDETHGQVFRRVLEGAHCPVLVLRR